MILPNPASALPPVPAKGLVESLVIGTLVIGTICAWTCHKTRETHAIQQADQHHEAAVTAAAQGAAYDHQAAQQTPIIQSDAATVAALRAAVARLRDAAAVSHPAPLVVVAPGEGQPTGHPVEGGHPTALVPASMVVDLAPLVAKQDQLIQAQERQIQDQTAIIGTLTLSRDSWRLSAQQSSAEAVQLRAALAAQQGLTASALWKGRIQGFAVGIAGGYVAGRLR